MSLVRFRGSGDRTPPVSAGGRVAVVRGRVRLSCSGADRGQGHSCPWRKPCGPQRRAPSRRGKARPLEGVDRTGGRRDGPRVTWTRRRRPVAMGRPVGPEPVLQSLRPAGLRLPAVRPMAAWAAPWHGPHHGPGRIPGPEGDQSCALGHRVPLAGSPPFSPPPCWSPAPPSPASTSSARARGRRHRGLARLHRARRDRQEIRLGHRLREEDRVQGPGQDRQHLRRDGGPHERGGLRPGHRLGRRLAAPDRGRTRPGDQSGPGAGLQERRSAPPEGALASRQGKPYGVPYQWGYNVLAYNSEVFKALPKSWEVVFEEATLPDGKSNKGRVQAFDGPSTSPTPPCPDARKPELGIKNPYELDDKQYKAALELLREQRKIVAGTGTMPSSRSTTSRTKGWWPRRRGVSRSTCSGPRAGRSPAWSRRKARPDGPTRR